MRTVLLTTMLAGLAWAQRPDAALLQQTLSRHVTDTGGVRYASLKADLAPLQTFVEQMESVSPDTHPALYSTREARLAYWLNAYNGLVLHATAIDYPKEKRRLENTVTRAFFFYRRKFKIGGRERTLSEIEDTELREAFREPRIHFGIVCASKGCPWLSRTAFTARNVNTELERATALFMSQSRNCSIDTGKRRIVLSSIFKWFERDFGTNDRERLAFVARYRPAEAAALASGKWTIAYSEWDWSLNDAP